MRRGYTLIELVLALALTAVLVTSVFGVFVNAIGVGPKLTQSRVALEQKYRFENLVANLLHHVYVANNGQAVTLTANPHPTYFTTNPQNQNTGLTQGSGGGASQQLAAGGLSSAGNPGQTGELAFTALGLPTGQGALQDASGDFVQQNQLRGPQGGAVECEIGLHPVGDAGDQTGVFLRQQRPADADPTQGGYESLLLPGVDSITFEFWDGLEWAQSWDTTTQTPVELPAAVRVTYSTGNDTPTVFVVQLQTSQVTDAAPATDLGGGVAAGSGQ